MTVVVDIEAAVVEDVMTVGPSGPLARGIGVGVGAGGVRHEQADGGPVALAMLHVNDQHGRDLALAPCHIAYRLLLYITPRLTLADLNDKRAKNIFLHTDNTSREELCKGHVGTSI